MTDTARPSFQWDDPFRLDDLLGESERMIRDSTRAFAAERLLPGVTEAYLADRSDPGIYPAMGAMGLLGPTIPAEYGGAGASAVAYGLIAREIERVDSGYRSMLSVQSSLVMHPIHAYGTEEQKRTWLPGLAAGTKVGCFGLTEPDAGSDPAAMITRAEKIAGGWRLTGNKAWISNAPVADVLIVWAKSAADGGRIRGFLLTPGLAGLSTPAHKGKLSLRTSITGQIVMDGVEVGEDAVLPGAIGLSGPFGCLNRARYGICWGAMGAAEDCWHRARSYALERRTFGRPIAGTQLVQAKLVEMQTAISLGLLGALRLGRMMEDGTATPELISMMKRANCQTALEVARVARDIHGANGIAAEMHVMRHAQNLETVNTYEGTHDIHTLVLGRAQTGIAAF
jgi:glutaryl-CoA dehydrogenase